MASTRLRLHLKAPRAAVYRERPDETVVEVVEFETSDPTLQGPMTIRYALTEADGGTDLVAVHDDLPPGLSPADNERGWQEALAQLAALVEARRP